MASFLRCLWVVAILLLASSASAQNPPISEAAKLHFAVGVGLLEDPAGPRYAEAYESFRRAYKTSPSPKILSNVGLCALHLERDGEAIDAYEIYLSEVADIDPGEEARIRKDLVRLRAGLATVVLDTKPAGALITDERIPESGPPVINRYKYKESKVALRIRSGNHKITVEAEGYKKRVIAIRVAPGAKEAAAVALVEIPGAVRPPQPTTDPSPQPDPTPVPIPMPTEPDDGGGISGASIAMIAVTGAFTVGAVVVGVLSLQNKAEYDSFESGGSREDAEAVRSDGEVLNVVTDVLIGAAVASAAVTVILLVTTTDSGSTATLSASPRVGGATLDLDVAF